MNLKEYKTKKMNDPEFAKAYEEIQPEMNVIRAIIDARISQNMTQKELAERTGIAQTEISKLENGTRNPSIKLLQRLAEGMDMVLSFTHPKNKCQKLPHINEAHRSSIVLIDKQADECYYLMLANANLDYICLMPLKAVFSFIVALTLTNHIREESELL